MPRSQRNNKFYRNLIIIVVLVIVSCISIRLTTPARNAITPIESLLRGVLAPLQSGATGISKNTSDFIQNIVSLGKLQEENKQLKAQLQQITLENNQLEEYRQQNLRLRQLLDLKTQLDNQFELKAAEVIARDSKTWDKVLLINRGKKDGLQKDMTVLTYEGIVGRISTVTNNTAEVLLLQNRDGAVAGLIQSSRFPGVVEGTTDDSGLLQMVHLPYDAPVEENQIVVTSGLGGIVPKGLRIGYIVSVKTEPNGLMKKAIIKPFVDLNRLEEVLVVTSVKGGNY